MLGSFHQDKHGGKRTQEILPACWGGRQGGGGRLPHLAGAVRGRVRASVRSGTGVEGFICDEGWELNKTVRTWLCRENRKIGYQNRK